MLHTAKPTSPALVNFVPEIIDSDEEQNAELLARLRERHLEWSVVHVHWRHEHRQSFPRPGSKEAGDSNSKSITKLATLIDWTPDELANHLLAETLETFADEYSGALEWFLGAIYYPDRPSAQRALDRAQQAYQLKAVPVLVVVAGS
jgi:hypothetical protein